MNEEPHADLGYVVASKYRCAVLTALQSSILCPTEISERTKYHPNHVSNTLSELRRRDLVICLNPKDRKGKLYRLTSDGKIVCAQLACRDKL